MKLLRFTSRDPDVLDQCVIFAPDDFDLERVREEVLDLGNDPLLAEAMDVTPVMRSAVLVDVYRPFYG